MAAAEAAAAVEPLDVQLRRVQRELDAVSAELKAMDAMSTQQACEECVVPWDGGKGGGRACAHLAPAGGRPDRRHKPGWSG